MKSPQPWRALSPETAPRHGALKPERIPGERQP